MSRGLLCMVFSLGVIVSSASGEAEEEFDDQNKVYHHTAALFFGTLSPEIDPLLPKDKQLAREALRVQAASFAFVIFLDRDKFSQAEVSQVDRAYVVAVRRLLGWVDEGHVREFIKTMVPNLPEQYINDYKLGKMESDLDAFFEMKNWRQSDDEGG